MEFVEPIKEIKTIKQIQKILQERSTRDYLFFVLGINTGILVSHLLKMKVKDVYDGIHIREYFVLQEDKKSAEKYFYLNEKVRKALEDYFHESGLKEEEYLFKSQKNNLPITRQQAYRIINKVAREAGVSSPIGTHTLRKTFGYHAYRKGVAISLLQSIFHHATRAETLRYIGIQKEEVFKVQIDVNL
ncbi:tyrosine-type recombinase/integrase [Caldalkalibacillus mannanilyticus]|uniref:tyrosine-type recombinase/integrase n=1 Tax=Caldalkalibacillus mannanilyticus TaxID=1418 RepID=UPI0004694126|nr:tyrosine-type recombinase/integrase [Caldalkalibacillus mannanilyticus]